MINIQIGYLFVFTWGPAMERWPVQGQRTDGERDQLPL